MPRAALILLLAAGLGTAGGAAAQSVNPHVDRSVVPGGCMTCHQGHGASQSPMLPVAQDAICLRCHGTQTDLEAMIATRHLAPDASPPLLFSVLQEAYVHPLTQGAFSRYQSGVVTCTSCHSPHRRSLPQEGALGVPRLSPLDPSQLEYVLCESCHGGGGATTQSLTDISRWFDPANASYHPLKAPALDASPSVFPELRGREVSCGDCHGNRSAGGPRGPHGSSVPFILRRSYTTADGEQESFETYNLCYTCHDREVILESPVFPEHGEHIVDERTSCATCHNAHGSVLNRALIRFGEEARIGRVAPSASGELRFESTGPGSGLCYLTCHGRDHDPEGYGLDADLNALGLRGGRR